MIKTYIRKALRKIIINHSSLIDNNCIIGKYTHIARSVSIAKATIGRYSIIGNNVSIGQGERDYTQVALSGKFYNFDIYEKYTEKQCIIGSDVLIGVDAVILRGVTIGNGAIIGANSVVTHDIPDYAIAVGCPAKVIKYRFNQKIRQLISNSHWWEYDFEEAKEIVTTLEKKIFTNDF